MNIYALLKLNRHIRSTRVKLFGIWLLHCFRKRYFGLFLDKEKVHAQTLHLEEKYGMDNAKIEEVLNMHLRTSYK